MLYMFFLLAANGRRYKIVGDFGAFSLSIGAKNASENCTLQTTSTPIFYTAC